jgi:hypothetical protein
MRIALFSLLAFLIGYQVVHGGEGRGPLAQELLQRQEKLVQDIERMSTARKELIEVMETRSSGEFILSKEEEKLERTSRVQLHIFMERYRNDTLEILAMYEKVLGKTKKRDLLEETFGKTLTEVVSVGWTEQGLEELMDEINEGYNVAIFIKGNVDLSLTMSLRGDMSVAAIFEHIRNTFRVKLIQDDGELWLTHDDSVPEPDEE